MTKPKTYGEFADQMQDVHIDERVRDREISEDAWRILNLHNEIPEDVKDHFDIQDVTVSYVDFYDDDNVAIVATTKDCYEPIVVSAVVGDRFEATVDCLTDCERETLEFDDSEEMFEVLEEALTDGIDEDENLREIDRERFEDAVKHDPELADHPLSEEPWKLFRATFYDLPEASEHAFLERIHRQIQARYDEHGVDVQIDDCDLGEGEDSIGIDIRASWANPERKGEELRRRIQIYARDGHIEFEHEDDVIYKSRETDVPLDVQYHIGYGRDGQGVPFDEKDIHASFDAVVAKVDTLMANLPERETILPKDIKSIHELRLSTVAPHVQDVLDVKHERLYVFGYANPDGTVDNLSVDVTAGREKYGKSDASMHIERDSNTTAWNMRIESVVGGLKDRALADDASWKLETDKLLRTFGEFVESEYHNSIVSDLDDQQGLEK